MTAYTLTASHALGGIGNGFNHRVVSSRRLDWRIGAKCLESSQIQLECDVCRPLDGIKESVAAPDIVWAAIGT